MKRLALLSALLVPCLLSPCAITPKALAAMAASEPPPAVDMNATNDAGQPGGNAPVKRSATSGCSSDSALDFDGATGSNYIPMDSWIYDAMDRLQGLGYVDSAFLGLRPWTRLSVLHMLQETSDKVDSHPGDSQALDIFTALCEELAPDNSHFGTSTVLRSRIDTVYNTFRGVSGTPLRDSYHLGQTFVNDYGRPYQGGFNNYGGFSGSAGLGRFTLYFRGEYQHAPSAAGYSQSLSALLSSIDGITYSPLVTQATVPQGPIATSNFFRMMEANLSFHIAGHEISFGKNDHWLGPAKGGSMAWSTNAENIYAFEINRVEPLRIPLLSHLLGPFRYDFYVGSLKGHTEPNDPWVHAEKISMKPTRNLEVGFERTVIWGGKDHVPITVHSFLRSFFSFQNVSLAEKYSRQDPGARFGSFDFDYRLPLLRNWVSLYSDSEAHDDVNPISAPRRSAVRPGLYLSHVPGVPALDLRVEGVSSDPVSDAHLNGNFLFYESVQKQGTTNKGFLFTDEIGRDAKGGQAWLTYHLSPRENIQFSYRNAKADHDFIPFGTTQNVFMIAAVKRIRRDVELKGDLQQEEWKAPVYKPGRQMDTGVSGEITWYLHDKGRITPAP